MVEFDAVCGAVSGDVPVCLSLFCLLRASVAVVVQFALCRERLLCLPAQKCCYLCGISLLSLGVPAPAYMNSRLVSWNGLVYIKTPKKSWNRFFYWKTRRRPQTAWNSARVELTSDGNGVKVWLFLQIDISIDCGSREKASNCIRRGSPTESWLLFRLIRVCRVVYCRFALLALCRYTWGALTIIHRHVGGTFYVKWNLILMRKSDNSRAEVIRRPTVSAGV